MDSSKIYVLVYTDPELKGAQYQKSFKTKEEANRCMAANFGRSAGFLTSNVYKLDEDTYITLLEVENPFYCVKIG